MDWSTLVVAILTSSVVGAVVSSLFSEWQKRNDYKRDYYKKIIDKRIDAYEKMAKVLGRIGTKAYYSIDGENKEIYVCFENYESLECANSELISILNEVQWISPQTYKELWRLNDVIASVFDRVLEDSKEGKVWTPGDFRDAGLNEFENIKNFLIVVNNARLKDMAKLDKVEEFFKEQKCNLKS